MKREEFLSSVYIIIKDGDNILLQRRTGTNLYCGFLALPAGHIDLGENAYDAVLREGKEELGIKLNKEDIVDSFIVQRRSKVHGPYYDVYFQFNRYEGNISIKEPNKCTELKWVNENDLPQDMIKYERDAIAMNKSGKKFDCIDVYVEE